LQFLFAQRADKSVFLMIIIASVMLLWSDAALFASGQPPELLANSGKEFLALAKARISRGFCGKMEAGELWKGVKCVLSNEA